jgi:hypothetical protein
VNLASGNYTLLRHNVERQEFGRLFVRLHAITFQRLFHKINMESIKNAIGLGSAEQQGQEPVNSATGAGTAGEPYDQGNSEGEICPFLTWDVSLSSGRPIKRLSCFRFKPRWQSSPAYRCHNQWLWDGRAARPGAREWCEGCRNGWRALRSRKL